MSRKNYHGLTFPDSLMAEYLDLMRDTHGLHEKEKGRAVVAAVLAFAQLDRDQREGWLIQAERKISGARQKARMEAKAETKPAGVLEAPRSEGSANRLSGQDAELESKADKNQ
jgi:hypothetical protein